MNLPNPFPGLAINVKAQVAINPNQSTTYKFKRAGKNGTLITMIIDESGSMMSAWEPTISGFNEFVEGQKAAEATAGAGFLSLIKFDAPEIKTVFTNRPLSEVPKLDKLTYTPRGATNLLDAIGHAINSVNAELAKVKKKDRPGVIITIMTDGQENASHKFNNSQIKEMVKAAEAADWTFTFLGANIDSFAVGSTFGMNVNNSVDYSTNNMTATMAAVSASTTRMRSAKLAGTSTHDLYASSLYTDDEKKNMTK
jgi:von Willebrand factor type A domain